ncbi:MAG TPA: hypothetical protein PK156_38420 [Polyangium sp.]|nr:hypothetical protein [Polyangium sp.]
MRVHDWPIRIISITLLCGCAGRTELMDYVPDGDDFHEQASGIPGFTTSAGTNAGGFGGMGSGGEPGKGGGEAGAAGTPVSTGIYVNGRTRLYEIDVDASNIISSTHLDGCPDEMLDIAIQRTGELIGVTSNSVFGIDSSSGHCILKNQGFDYPNSLAFVPAIPSGDEILVGYRDGTYCRIDPATGIVHKLGSLDPGYTSSGDLAVVDGHVYASVKGPGCNDCLVEIDRDTGTIRQFIGAMSMGNVFGLAQHHGMLYGFSQQGLLARIDRTSASIQTQPIVNALPDLNFWGAASLPDVS